MSGGAVPAVGVWVFPEVPAPELVDLARQVEDLGLDELWVGDEGPARDPFAVLAAAAVVTDRIRLATGITNPYVRHPGVAAARHAHDPRAQRRPSRARGRCGGPHVALPVRPAGPPGRSSVFASSSTSPARLRPGRRRRVTRPATSPWGRRPRARRCRCSWERAGLGSTGSRPSGPTVRSWPACLRFATPTLSAGPARCAPIDIALYPSVAFTEKAVQRHRPEMIWALLDTPPETREELGLDGDAVKAAAEAIRGGDPEPARALVDDTVLERVMLVGQPSVVGRRLAELVREHRPTSIGLALLQDDLHEGVCDAAEAFAAMAAELGGDRWSA